MAELSEKDLSALKEMYEQFERETNGKVTKTELRKGLQKIGRNPTQEFVDDLMKELGVKDEIIQYGDFEKCLKVIMVDNDYNNEEELREAFKVFDKDGSGFIDRGELTKVLKEIGEKLTDEEVEELFKDADKNGDEKINYEEFSKMMA